MSTNRRRFDWNAWTPYVAYDPSEIEEAGLARLESERKKLYATIQAFDENARQRAATVATTSATR